MRWGLSWPYISKARVFRRSLFNSECLLCWMKCQCLSNTRLTCDTVVWINFGKGLFTFGWSHRITRHCFMQHLFAHKVGLKQLIHKSIKINEPASILKDYVNVLVRLLFLPYSWVKWISTTFSAFKQTLYKINQVQFPTWSRVLADQPPFVLCYLKPSHCCSVCGDS